MRINSNKSKGEGRNFSEAAERVPPRFATRICRPPLCAGSGCRPRRKPRAHAPGLFPAARPCGRAFLPSRDPSGTPWRAFSACARSFCSAFGGVEFTGRGGGPVRATWNSLGREPQDQVPSGFRAPRKGAALGSTVYAAVGLVSSCSHGGLRPFPPF